MLHLSDLKPGDMVDRYEILMPVARGGMAAVWAARLQGSRGFQKLFAIKTMLPAMVDDPDFEAMFLDEARLASQIRHPYVVQIIDLGEMDDWFYLVMEWVNGETIFTLNKAAKASGGIPLPVLLRIVSDACAGLHAAHELKDDKGQPLDLVHRDISPQNVMISFDGIVKIVDFGVAKAAGRTHETRVAGLMKGKVPYLSPEQITSGKVDRRADIFALGILMYVMLSGRHPFRGENDTKTMDNICMRLPVPLRQLVPDIAPELEAVVMKALEKDPENRWSNCADMQRGIDQVRHGLGVTVTDGDVAKFVRSVLGNVLLERNENIEAAIAAADERAAARKSAARASSADEASPSDRSAADRARSAPELAAASEPSAAALPPSAAPRSPSLSRPDAAEASLRSPSDSGARPALRPGVRPHADSPPSPSVPSRGAVHRTAPELAREATPKPPPRPPGAREATPRPAPRSAAIGAPTIDPVAPPRRRRRSPTGAYVLVAAAGLLAGGAFLVRAGRLPSVAERLPPFLHFLSPAGAVPTAKAPPELRAASPAPGAPGLATATPTPGTTTASAKSTPPAAPSASTAAP